MRGTAACIAVFLGGIAGCQKAPPAKVAVVGGTFLRGTSAAAVPRSIIIAGNGLFLAAGAQGDVPLPADAEKVDAGGKFVMATPVRVPNDIGLARFTTQAEGMGNLDKKEIALQGIPTAAVDEAVIARLRDGGVIVAPFLSRFEGSAEERKKAAENVRTLAKAGVGIASFGNSMAHREWQMLEEAGFNTEQIIDSATTVAARALEMKDRGGIAPGMRADLVILSCNPLEHLFCLSKVERQMEDGRWITPRPLGEH